jgi:2-methylcitrate dehydratase PrpD
VASGVPVEDATVAVLALAPGDDAGLVEFRRSVERDIALGAPPAAAAAVRLNATARDGLPGARRP